MTLSVVIVGRPNVGKSTLFNRLVGKKIAIVHNDPGVTRDRRIAPGRIADLRFDVVDTAGLEDASDEKLESRMFAQTEIAVEDAGVVLFVIDGRAGVTPLDRYFADWLRTVEAPVILLVNKCEGHAGNSGVAESYKLGFGGPIPISAEHADGMGDLYDALQPHVDEEKARSSTDKKEGSKSPLQLAIIGRPNVGKSTLVNRLLGEDRMLTGPEAGITRDSISTRWSYKGRAINLVDTAGLRRKAKMTEKVEALSANDTLRAIRYAQVVVLLLDGEQMIEKQDLTIARTVIEEGRAMIIAINKWDLVKNREEMMQKLNDRLVRSLPRVRGIPVVTFSALTGRGIDRLLPAVGKIFEIWNRRISTGKLNDWLAMMTEEHPPPLAHGKRIRIRYMTQPKSRPPTFALFVSRPIDLPESYLRYLENGLRESFGLDGVPLRLNMRKGKNPFAPK